MNDIIEMDMGEIEHILGLEAPPAALAPIVPPPATTTSFLKKMEEAATHKWHGVPVWGWTAIAGVAGYLAYRHYHNQSNQMSFGY